MTMMLLPVVACSSYSEQIEPSPVDGGSAGVDAGADAGSSLPFEGGSPVTGTYCGSKSSARWCFDFEGTNFGTWQGKTWTDNSQVPGLLRVDKGALLSSIPPWSTDDPGRAHVFLDASFTSTLSFEWSFTVEEMGSGRFALIAEIVGAGEQGVMVYAIDNSIAFRTNAEDIAIVPKPSTYPVRFGLTLAVEGTRAKLDITMDNIRQTSTYEISTWTPATTRVGLGIGQVDATPEPSGRRFRYDDILVETQ